MIFLLVWAFKIALGLFILWFIWSHKVLRWIVILGIIGIILFRVAAQAFFSALLGGGATTFMLNGVSRLLSN